MAATIQPDSSPHFILLLLFYSLRLLPAGIDTPRAHLEHAPLVGIAGRTCACVPMLPWSVRTQ